MHSRPFSGDFSPALPQLEVSAAKEAWRLTRQAKTACEPKLQRIALESWLAARFSASVCASAFIERVSKLIGRDSAHLLSSRWPELAKRLKPHSIQCALRTVLNGWPTRHRLHCSSGPIPCLFGCRCGHDSLEDHYWKDCPALAQITVDAWGARVSGDSLHRDWACLERLDILAYMYTFYSAIARSHKQGRSINSRDAAVAARVAHSLR